MYVIFIRALLITNEICEENICLFTDYLKTFGVIGCHIICICTVMG